MQQAFTTEGTWTPNARPPSEARDRSGLLHSPSDHRPPADPGLTSAITTNPPHPTTTLLYLQPAAHTLGIANTTIYCTDRPTSSFDRMRPYRTTTP